MTTVHPDPLRPDSGEQSQTGPRPGSGIPWFSALGRPSACGVASGADCPRHHRHCTNGPVPGPFAVVAGEGRRGSASLRVGLSPTGACGRVWAWRTVSKSVTTGPWPRARSSTSTRTPGSSSRPARRSSREGSAAAAVVATARSRRRCSSRQAQRVPRRWVLWSQRRRRIEGIPTCGAGGRRARATGAARRIVAR